MLTAAAVLTVPAVSTAQPVPAGTAATLAGTVAGSTGGPAGAPGPGAVGDPQDGLEGTPSRPTRDVAATKKRQAAARTLASDADRSASEPVTGYARSAETMQPVAVGSRSYEASKVWPVGGWGTRDATGVRMFTWAGQTTQWNHPVGQAQYALYNLDSYRLTQDPAYLATAVKNAQRLVDRRVESAGAWYYPYDFDFAVHGDTTQMLVAPWYSAMAQGQALSVFTRLFEVTSDPSWRLAADATFLSLLQQPEGTAPFASRVDSAGRLWLEEYPRYPVQDSEMVLNGHIYAMYGLHDYWQLTGDANARSIFLGALSTIEKSVMTGFRRPGWLSVYSLRHQLNTLSYHPVHIGQFLVVWRMTRDARWLDTATAFRTDYPTSSQSGQLRITPRVRTMYRIGSSGAVSSSRTVSFSRNTSAPFDRRQRLKGGPIAYRISAGAYTGWWVAEGFGVAWGLGAVDRHGYLPETPVVFRAGATFTAYRLDSRGEVVGSKTITIGATRSSQAPTRYSAIVTGRPSYYFHSGALAGYWLPLQSKIYLP